MGIIVHLNGFPGTGKLTIARELAPRLNARVLDNHTLMNPARALFEREDPAFGALRKSVRELVFEAAAKMPADTNLILTDAIADEPAGQAIFDAVAELATLRGDRLVPVILDLDAAENEKRLTSPERAALHKLMDVEIFRHLKGIHGLLAPDGATRLDITGLSVEQAVAKIETLIKVAGHS